MNVGLWNLEPKIENTALMQVSQFHKQQGDHVELYSPLFNYDKVYDREAWRTRYETNNILGIC